MERKAMEAERTSVKYKQVEFMADKIGQVLMPLFPELLNGACLPKSLRTAVKA
jgi:hypothetical protein